MKSKLTHLSPAMELTALLAHPQMRADQVERARSLISLSDLQEFQRLLEQHRVWPAVFCNVRDYFPNDLPLVLVDDLEIKYKDNAQRAAHQFFTATTLKRAFAERGISVHIVKGLDIAERLYGDIAKRHSKDIDLLINERDAEAAGAVLEEFRYASASFSAWRNGGRQYRELFELRYKDFVFHGNGNCIELHTRLTPHREPLAEHFQRLIFEPATANPLEVEVAKLLYLLWHGGNFGLYRRIKWLVDVATFLDQPACQTEVFWTVLTQRARELKCMRALCVGLTLSNKVYQTALPREIAQTLDFDSRTQRLVKAAVVGWHDGITLSKTWLEILHWRYLSLGLIDQPARRAQQHIFNLFAPTVGDLKMLNALPDRLLFLGWFVRPIGVINRRIGRTSQPAQRSSKTLTPDM